MFDYFADRLRGFLTAGRKGGAEHLRLGRRGEDIAVKSLAAQGYKIIERNAKISRREVDVIAREGDFLVFVEVKTRSDHSFGRPLEAVVPGRAERLRQAARIYSARNGLRGVSIRFDIVTVDFACADGPEVEIIRNAF